MATWDIFHNDRLETERNQSTAAVRAKIAEGEILRTDLVRVAGSGEPWSRLEDHAGLAALLAAPVQPPPSPPEPPPPAGPAALEALLDEDDEPDSDASGFDRFVLDEDLDQGEAVTRRPSPASMPPLPSGVRKGTTEDLDPTAYPDSYDRDLDLSLRDPESRVALPVDDDHESDDDYDPEAEDEEAAGFTFARGGAETVEELDLAAMVDVAFQLVLFFLVTASTIVFKALELPKPNPEDAKGAAVQSAGRTLDDLQKDFILVEIDPNGGVMVDHENAPNDFNGLAARLRELREKTQRLSMLLTADASTPHKYAVNAYDAANEIGLKIAIAQPKPAPIPPPVPPAVPRG